MNVPKNVHAWEIEGYGKVDLYLRDLIRKKLIEKYGSLHKAEIALKLSDYYHRKLHQTFRRKDILFRLVDEAEINKNEAEEHIQEWIDTKPHKPYFIQFPIEINPIIIRIISHIIGDGTLGSNFTWTQKDVTPLENLEKRVLGRSSKNQKKVITIPRILIKAVCKSLNLELTSLTKEKLIERLVLLPKEYQIQVLTALIEDEGTIDKNRITIRMTEKKIMECIVKLIDALGYSRSNLTEQVYNYHQEKRKIFKIDLNLEGIKKYCQDIEETETKYGLELGLWTKRDKVKELSMHKSNLHGWRRDKNIAIKILELVIA